VSTYTIGEVAQRSGFTASALRYYEDIGLVPPEARTEGGYRIYGDHTLGRLAFIARAKQLGCSLEEITDLVAIWDGERCAPVQRRLHELVTEKIGRAQRQVVELTAFASQLQQAASQLGGTPSDGPCGEGCACLAPTASASTAPVVLGARPADVPIACTLEPDEMPARLAGWQAILGAVRARQATEAGGLRLQLSDDVDLAELSRLVVAEQRCCAFLSFAITVDGRGVGLEIDSPAGAADLVAALFGRPT
jgi:DNA-binding transcriptional MerR regulator